MYSPTRLQEALDAQGRRVDWLAEMTGYDPSTISRYLNGVYPISEKFARAAAKHLGIPAYWLRETVAVEPSAA